MADEYPKDLVDFMESGAAVFRPLSDESNKKMSIAFADYLRIVNFDDPDAQENAFLAELEVEPYPVTRIERADGVVVYIERTTEKVHWWFE